MNKRFAALLVLVILFSLILAHIALAAGTIAIEWWAFGGGGGPATAGMITLNDTLGQPVIGPSSSDSLSLGAGYWYGAAVEYRLYLPLVLLESP